jgi:hypothetical protein
VVVLEAGSISVQATIPLPDNVDPDAAQQTIGSSSSLGDAIVSNVAAVPGVANISSGTIGTSGVTVAVHVRPVSNFTMVYVMDFDGIWTSSEGQSISVTDGVSSFDGLGRYPIISTNGHVAMMGLTPTDITATSVTWVGGNTTVVWNRVPTSTTVTNTIATTTTVTVTSTESATFTTVPPCNCRFTGSSLPRHFYLGTSYSSEEVIRQYGTYCAAWDSMEGTPWYGFCPPGADFCDSAFNWCTAPWCYVYSSCDTATQTSVFYPQDLYYSYEACGAPNCYTTFDTSAGCPYIPRVHA